MSQEEKNEKFKVHTTENYNTLFIGNKGNNKQDQQAVANLINLITNSEANENKQAVINQLKKKGGKELLMECIASVNEEKFLKPLIRICWESGIDFTDYFETFVGLLERSDIETTLDLHTLIEDMQGPVDSQKIQAAESSIGKLKAASDSTKKEILNDILLSFDKLK